jgi:hypothetical protein
VAVIQARGAPLYNTGHILRIHFTHLLSRTAYIPSMTLLSINIKYNRSTTTMTTTMCGHRAMTTGYFSEVLLYLVILIPANPIYCDPNCPSGPTFPFQYRTGCVEAFRPTTLTEALTAFVSYPAIPPRSQLIIYSHALLDQL